MQGSVPAGSDVRLEGDRLYWPGDIVAFKRGDDEVVSHRFLGYLPGRRGWRVITRADNANALTPRYRCRRYWAVSHR